MPEELDMHFDSYLLMIETFFPVPIYLLIIVVQLFMFVSPIDPGCFCELNNIPKAKIDLSNQFSKLKTIKTEST